MRILKDQKGQGALEYLLMIATSLAIVAVVASYLIGFPKRIGNLSQQKFNVAAKNVSKL